MIDYIGKQKPLFTQLANHRHASDKGRRWDWTMLSMVWPWWLVLAFIAGSKSSPWDILRASLNQEDPHEWALEKLGRESTGSLKETSLPTKITDEADLRVLNSYMNHFTKTEEGLQRALSLLVSESLNPVHFKHAINSRKQWLSTWQPILTAIREKSGSKFKAYFMCVLDCIPYMEVLAANLQVFSGLHKEPISTYVRLSPFYYIAKADFEDSERLRREFSAVIAVSEQHPVDAYLPVLEDYLKGTKYLQRAMSNEREYHDLNEWIYRHFLLHPQAIKFVIKHDLYHLAYIAFLPGLRMSKLTELGRNCAYGTLAMFLARNKPEKVQFKLNTCPEISSLVRLYEKYSTLAASVPCRPPSIENKPTICSVGVELARIKRSKLRYFAEQMLLGRLAQVPFEYKSYKDWHNDRKKNTEKRHQQHINRLMREYCDMYDMIPNIIFQ